uniref:Uncharacterized protein n=1 Tax=Gasterosteus aculeatus TaxID=69293 RepID=G3NQD2_GASAC
MQHQTSDSITGLFLWPMRIYNLHSSSSGDSCFDGRRRRGRRSPCVVMETVLFVFCSLAASPTIIRAKHDDLLLCANIVPRFEPFLDSL